MIIGFYQLLHRAPEAVLPALVLKAVAAGHRLLVRAPDAALLARLDEALWVGSPRTSFLPHARADGLSPARAAAQPVLLAIDWPPANGADMLMQVGGDLPDALDGLARAAFIFGEAELEVARARWRRVKAMAGAAPAYWRETEGGRFEQAA